MNNGLATLNQQTARLPEVYNAARASLEKCASIDECQEWGDKAAALASYARQADDKSLQTMAERIRARAIQRCGELLQNIEKAKNQHDAEKRAGTDAPTSRIEAAKGAGLSKHQAVQAVRVANVPKEEFEELVESEEPPTITELAERGTEKRPKPLVDLGGRDPKDFNHSMHAIGDLREFVRKVPQWDCAAIVRGSSEDSYGEILTMIRSARQALVELEMVLRKAGVQ